MSRIGKLPINIPAGVTITVDDDNTVTVKGPKGTLKDKFASSMEISQDAGMIHVKRNSEEKEIRAIHGLTRSLLNNMVHGVTNGFKKDLEIEGVGYKAALQGKKLVINIGYSHPVEIEQPEGITFEVPAPNRITVKGIDKQQVGQVAADIRAVRKPSPYISKQGAGKGIKYAGEKVRHKVGKTK